jgi:hypothetical protein
MEDRPGKDSRMDWSQPVLINLSLIGLALPAAYANFA